MPKALNIPKTGTGFTARYWTADEINTRDRGFDMPPVEGGIAEIHIGEKVYIDEWVADEAAAQAWIDDYDFEHLDAEQGLYYSEPWDIHT
jgi:hypothetical protein